MVTSVGAEHNRFDFLVEKDQILYLSAAHLDERDLHSLILALLDRYNQPLSRLCRNRLALVGNELVSTLFDKLALQRDVHEAACLLTEAAQKFFDSSSSSFLYYDSVTGSLCNSRSENLSGDDSICSGLIGFVANTFQTLCVNNIGLDGRYDAEIDNPEQLGNDARLLSTAVRDSYGDCFGAAGSVTVVLFPE